MQTPDVLGTFAEMADFDEAAGKRLRGARERLGLSQFDAAHKLGVTDKTLGKWERAQATPRARQWKNIEEVYGVTIAEIRGEPEPAQLDRLEHELAEVRKMIEQLLAGGPIQIVEALEKASEDADKKRAASSSRPAAKKTQNRRAS